MSADSNSDNGGKAPLSGRGRGSSSEGDQTEFNSSKNLRTGTYQKRTEARPSMANNQPSRHRMTMREL